MKMMRTSTIQTLGLGTVLGIFKNGLPVTASDAVSNVFGKASNRGSLVISGANGIVGAGKTMQLGSRLQPHGVRIIGLDFPSAPDGIGRQYPGLVRAFGRSKADEIMRSIIRMSYDGTTLPGELGQFNPKFLLEAIPEILSVKKDHYGLFRAAFPGIHIRSVTSGFPSSELGVGIAHPAFPHEVSKVWETVGDDTSTDKLFWALGMIPIPVADKWSFVLDVLFCGLTLAGLRYHQASNMPYWKIDKFIRKLLGPNPFRAHDAIGAAGANFLTWSCLHHLHEHYGAELFAPTPELMEHKESRQDWYPPDHFRPLVNWSLDTAGVDEFKTWILGPLFQMTSLMLHENRGHLSHINAIGELCAQFNHGILAVIRGLGPDNVIRTVESYHLSHPEAASVCWCPSVFGHMDTPEWQQLYVNAEHDGTVGVIAISRESYNSDVDAELNRAIDWLKAEGIERVIVSGDFHLSTQLVGADTSEFYPALENVHTGHRISMQWSRTARRLNDKFKVSVGFVNGKRCLGGMLELLMHCHFLISVNDAKLGMPEVTLPVVPGMEGCHWPFRKARRTDWPKIIYMLLSGHSIDASEAVGWLIDHAAPMTRALEMAWKVATGGDHGLTERNLKTDRLTDVPLSITNLPDTDNASTEFARKAIMNCIQEACGCNLNDSISRQADHSAHFMISEVCRGGRVGRECDKVMKV
ncbi:MAG: hypothetical protein ABIJ92_00855 [Candidatus Aenigmatarchaeota archaeon]